MQPTLLLSTVISLQALVSARPVAPRRGDLPRPLVYIRSFEWIECPNQGRTSFEQVHRHVAAPEVGAHWVPEEQAYHYNWWVIPHGGPGIIHNQIWFKVEKNDGFEQYRFTKASWLDPQTGKSGACQLQA